MNAFVHTHTLEPAHSSPAEGLNVHSVCEGAAPGLILRIMTECNGYFPWQRVNVPNLEEGQRLAGSAIRPAPSRPTMAMVRSVQIAAMLLWLTLAASFLPPRSSASRQMTPPSPPASLRTAPSTRSPPTSSPSPLQRRLRRTTSARLCS